MLEGADLATTNKMLAGLLMAKAALVVEETVLSVQKQTPLLDQTGQQEQQTPEVAAAEAQVMVLVEVFLDLQAAPV